MVDKDGNTVKYDKPLNPAPAASKRASQKPKKWSTPLGRSGWPSLRELGHQTILQVFSAAHSREVLASMPGPDQSREWAKLPRRATATRTSAAERTALGVAENLRSLIQRMRYPENARILSDEISESMIGRRISPHTDQMLEAYRMRIESVTRRFGPVVTKGQAKEALAKAFPNLLNDIQELQFRRWGTAGTGHTWPFDSEEMTPRQRNWVMSLLHSSMERPDIAANVIAIEHINDDKQRSNADACVTFGLTGKGTDIKFGYSIRLQEGAYADEEVRFAGVFQKALEVAGLLKAEQSDPQGLHAQLLRRVRAGSNQLTDWVAGNRETIDMLNDPNISSDEARGFHAFRLGLHEWGHLTDFAARLEDIGVDLSDDNQNLEWFIANTQLEYGQFPGQAQKAFSLERANLLLEHSRGNGAVSHSRVGDGGHFLHMFTGYTPANEVTDYDNLSTRQVITLERIMHSLVSQY
ncbi:MAG: hypothetical protein JHC94_07400, partial [Acidimicrobiia bacterium]|nr:hypothetical protein [Acidimicrobiia bacterium]